MKQESIRTGAIGDVKRAEKAVTELLEALGYNTQSQRLKDTPARVVQAFLEFTKSRSFEISTFDNTSTYEEPLLIKDISFVSVCEHHLLPFYGIAHIGYVPEDQIVGLSVLPYVVERFAHELTLQEPLTDDIADYLHENLSASKIAVAIEADHMCMQARGVRAAGAKTLTHAFRGTDVDEHFRSWFFESIHAKG